MNRGNKVDKNSGSVRIRLDKECIPMHRISSLIFIVFLIAMAVGCSGGGGNPALPGIQNDSTDFTSPGMDDDRQGEELIDPGLQLTESNSDNYTSSDVSHYSWGLYQATLDTVAETIDIIPLREANLHLNILRIMEPGGTYGWFQLASGFTWNTGMTELDFDMSLTNPLFDMDQFSAFDMKVIIITKGTLGGFSNSGFTMSSLSEMRLKNADGYTRWWNPTEFVGNNFMSYTDGALGFKHADYNLTSTLNGYKYFADDLGKDDTLDMLVPATRGFFRAGSTNLRHFKFWLPTLPASLVFNYSIDVSWAPPVPDPPVNLPDDFPPEANQAEPWLVTATETLNELFYEPGSGDNGGQLVLDVNIYDWHSPLPVSEGGTIQGVFGEWPGLFTIAEATYVQDMGDYAVYELTLVPDPDAITSNDDVEYMIWVEDSEEPGYNGILIGEPVISAVIFTTSVGDTPPNYPPVIESGVDGNASPGLSHETYSVTATDIDPLTYSWTVFDTPIVNDAGNGDGTLDIDWSDYGFGSYVISCTVTDLVNPPVDATPLDVMVGNQPPIVGDINGPIEVNASYTDAVYSVAASDLDAGQTLAYTWSFVPDGDPEDFTIPGDIVDGSLLRDFSAIDPGDYSVNIQVSDGFDDVTSTSIIVYHHNTLPEVGAVTGETDVTSLNTNEHYDATVTDPDTTQTLTFLWSVVLDGQPDDFSTPANPDGSLDIDWSTRPVGSYKVNKQADDGMDVGIGTEALVVLHNTPPEVGAVDGKTNVSSLDTAALYNAEPISDIDFMQVLSAHWSVVPTGEAPDYTILSLPDLSTAINWSTYTDGIYDVNIEVDDGFDQVEGTLLSVTKYDNGPPVVGAVNGPTPVYHSDTASEYTASMVDPDMDSLSVLWSVVPSGDAPDYVVMGLEGVPLTVDWSIVPDLGLYDINVQVDDSFNPPVEGTLLTVSLENTPPVINSCDGPTDVYSIDIAAHYTVDFSDIDIGQTFTVLWSVVPDGMPADYSLAANPDGSIDYNWALHMLGMYDVSVQVYDGYDYATCGPIDVIKHNTAPHAGTCVGPSPVDGFDVDAHYTCPIDDPDTFQTLTIMWSVVPFGDPPDYVIPDLGTGEVAIDWSGYDIGLWDVNVRVFDGIDTAEGILLTVERINTDPDAGQVDGPAPVDCTDNAAHYTAPISDPDTSQTLSAMWSLVETGLPADFSIPSNPDLSLDIDWSSITVGLYELNVQVFDGITTDDGMTLLVERMNTPPVVGSVFGPTMALASDIFNYYLDPSTYDCDVAQTLDYNWSIVPFGDPPSYTINTITDDIDIDWSMYGTGMWTIGCEVYDGVDYSYAGTLDVTVALCLNTDVHYYSGNLTPNSYSIAGMSVVPRADIAFVEGGISGLIQGKALVQIDNRRLGLFDADTNVPPTVPLTNTYDLLKIDTAISIDSDPSNGDPSPMGRVLIVTHKDPHMIKVMSSNTLIGNPFIDYLNSGSMDRTWVAIDVMGNGDFWAVMRDDSGGTPDFSLHLFTFLPYTNPGDDTYNEDLTATLNITGIVGSEDDIFDIAINRTSNALYLFEAGTSGMGAIQQFMLPTGLPPFHVGTVDNIFSQTLDYSVPGLTGYTGFAMYGDIDIDHADAGDEKCRILVYARLADMSAELRRFDEEFTLLDTESHADAATAFAINVDASVSTRNLIMPETDTVQWWETPVAW